ncbi:AraC family transcriptional regulator [Mangrovibacterium sp.]|uniref:AraC family transcriptional regulator n=1 Tax=Mangrovibacterium sp. TaxID=1961364 RepID=UPI003562E966
MVSNIESDKSIAQYDNSKRNFKKYLVISELDLKWGFVIKDSGYTTYPENSVYPAQGHPGTYMFSWKTGRVLNEYHLVLISNGEGIFESQSAGKQKIRSGDGFLLFPGEWHRYKPLKKSGWTEHWVGFSGKMADELIKEYFFKKENPIATKFNNQLVSKLFKTIHQLIEEEPFGFQRTASGLCIQLMIEFCNTQYKPELKRESSISRVKYIMNEKVDENIDFKTLAKNLGISYSKLRSDFKSQTGLPPLQYFLLLKIEKAKDLLQSTTLSSKQIAFNLGFESDFYFCRLFKKKVGLTPQKFRENEWAKIEKMS